MPHELILTKLNIPPPRPNLIPRPRLIERLNAGLHGKLTLVSAMAGSGKTTLVSNWVHGDQILTAWVNLEAGDNDPTRFFLYFNSAFQMIDDRLGAPNLIGLQSTQALPPESLLTGLINDISAQPQKLILVLDDYHVIENQTIHQALTFLLDHLPSQLHLVITTRSQPPLPLARLRAKGELNEIQAADLRFNYQETADLVDKMGLNISSKQVSALEARTEGWAAGLQLAAASLRTQRDPSLFIDTFTGSNRYILEYLTAEVLNQLPENVQDFLHHTSILGRLSAPLCDALTERDDSQKILKELDTGNLFITPLDTEQVWYRYHPLFADLLQNTLMQNDPEYLQILHHRASLWYEANGLVAEAVNHGLEARDYKRTSHLIAKYALEMVGRGEIRTLSHWLDRLPGEITHGDARLSLASALIAFLAGEGRLLRQSLEDARQAIKNLSESDPDKEQLQAEAQALQMVVAIEVGETFDLEVAQQTLHKLPGEATLLRASLAYALGVAFRSFGDVQAAGDAFSLAQSISEESGNLLTALVANYDLAELRADQGFLYEAERHNRQASEYVNEQLGELTERFPPMGAMFIARGRLLYEWGKLKEAYETTKEGIQLIEKVGGLGISKDGYLTLALIESAQGNLNQAIELIEKAEGIARGVKRPEVIARLTPHKVKLWLAQGDLKSALNWAEEQDFDRAHPPIYPFDLGYLTLARIDMALADARGEPEAFEQAIEMLERLLASIDATLFPRRVVESLMLQALALQASGETQEAVKVLSQALTLAGPEGHIALFLREGERLQNLLQKVAAKKLTPGYKARLLAGFEVSHMALSLPSTHQADDLPFVEPLSEREIEVLTLVAGGLSNREIADHLYISIGTVKRHLTNVYQKLGVSNRTGAVAIGQEYKLIP